jgi:hypothetical protein
MGQSVERGSARCRVLGLATTRRQRLDGGLCSDKRRRPGASGRTALIAVLRIVRVDGANADSQEKTLRELGLLAAWRESGLPADAFDDWVTHRVARQPAGSRAREVYGAGDTHDFARRAILAALALGPADHLLEIGCGGGLLLRDALATGAKSQRDRPQRGDERARARAGSSSGGDVGEGRAPAFR